VLRGNLAPDGPCSNPQQHLRAHESSCRAVVFETIEHYKERINDPHLDIDEHCVLVLKNAGPRGYPGMAEVETWSSPRNFLQAA